MQGDDADDRGEQVTRQDRHAREEQGGEDRGGGGDDELVTGVNITLGVLPESWCPAFDPGGDANVTIDDLVREVGKAVNGCGG